MARSQINVRVNLGKYSFSFSMPYIWCYQKIQSFRTHNTLFGICILYPRASTQLKIFFLKHPNDMSASLSVSPSAAVEPRLNSACKISRLCNTIGHFNKVSHFGEVRDSEPTTLAHTIARRIGKSIELFNATCLQPQDVAACMDASEFALRSTATCEPSQPKVVVTTEVTSLKNKNANIKFQTLFTWLAQLTATTPQRQDFPCLSPALFKTHTTITSYTTSLSAPFLFSVAEKSFILVSCRYHTYPKSGRSRPLFIPAPLGQRPNLELTNQTPKRPSHHGEPRNTNKALQCMLCCICRRHTCC